MIGEGIGAVKNLMGIITEEVPPQIDILGEVFKHFPTRRDIKVQIRIPVEHFAAQTVLIRNEEEMRNAQL